MMLNPRIQAAIVLLAAVVIGAATGTTVERMRGEPDRVDGPLEGPPPRRGPAEGRLPPPFERLALTEAQHELIRGVFNEYEPRTRAIMDEMFPRIRAVRDSARAEIDSILTDEQRARFAEMENFWDRRGGRRRGRGGRPGGPRPDTTRR